MRIVVPQSEIKNLVDFLRRAGYHAHIDPFEGKESWARRLSSLHYPRFHLYIKSGKVKNGGPEVWVFDLHLDQKKPSYQGSRKHSGEYESEAVRSELQRIYELIWTRQKR